MPILFTGGSGKAELYNIHYLLKSGHTILNLDQVIFDPTRFIIRIAKIREASEIYDVMSGYANYCELVSRASVTSFDALAHFAAILRLLRTGNQ